MMRSLKELNFNVEKNYVFNKKQTLYLTKSKNANINFRFPFEAIDGDVDHVIMLYFCCLFTPLPMETLMTPTFIGEIFGRKNIFGAIGLNC